MNEDKYLSFLIGLLIITVGGCCILENKYRSDVIIARERTNQIEMQFQYKMDSLHLANRKQK